MTAQSRPITVGSTNDEVDAVHSLAELERRQDDVLAQLDELDKKLSSLLTGLGVTLVDDVNDAAPALKIAAFDDDDQEDAIAAEAPATVRFDRRKVA